MAAGCNGFWGDGNFEAFYPARMREDEQTKSVDERPADLDNPHGSSLPLLRVRRALRRFDPLAERPYGSTWGHTGCTLRRRSRASVRRQFRRLLPRAPPPLAQKASRLRHARKRAFSRFLSGPLHGVRQLCAAAVPATMGTTTGRSSRPDSRSIPGTRPTRISVKTLSDSVSCSTLTAAAPGNPQRVTHLGHLNYWRNHVAHQKATPPPAGVPAVLTLADIQSLAGFLRWTRDVFGRYNEARTYTASSAQHPGDMRKGDGNDDAKPDRTP